MQTLFIATAFCMLVSYALCGIPFGVIVGRLFCGEDVRQKGSGNIGMTNVARVAGKKAAAITFLCDVGKAVCAMLIARCVLMPLCMQLSALGLSADITAELARAGARMLVAGSSVFKHEDRSRAIATIRAAAQDGVARA